jgi:hypothetical protein
VDRYIGGAPAAELVEVIVLPAHDDLDDDVQVIEVDVDRNLDTPPDERLHLVELDPEAGDVGHAAAFHGGACDNPVDRVVAVRTISLTFEPSITSTRRRY